MKKHIKYTITLKKRGKIMAFFSSKAICSICENECGLIKFQMKDKLWICSKCFKEAGLNTASPIRTMTPDIIKCMIVKKNLDADKLASFQVTKQVARWLKVDENAREWFIPDGFAGSIKNPRIHSYDDILDFELLEDGGSIIKGGLGRAVAGGILFGGVGAIVGGATGRKKGNPTCTSLKIKITLNDITSPTEYINLITTETEKRSIVYQTYQTQAHEILSLLQVMYESSKTEQNISAVTIQEPSSAEEIVKFKQLLDSGIITEEEFKAKKKQLLGL